MAKVELAYSLEINDIVDAMEANELWLEGILSDKRAFECVYEKKTGLDCCLARLFFSGWVWMHCHPLFEWLGCMYSPLLKKYVRLC